MTEPYEHMVRDCDPVYYYSFRRGMGVTFRRRSRWQRLLRRLGLR